MKKIKSLGVKNSAFFDDFKIHFDDKMNCIMGGRGTGKSTILYFLKSALNYDLGNNKMNELLKSNLGLGEIIIEMESIDGELYRIVKTFNEEPQPYKLSDQEYISLVRIFEQIECDFYETNQIEKIGTSAKDRLELIDKKIKNELYGYFKLVEKLQIDLDSNAQEIKIFNSRSNQIVDSLAQYSSIDEEFAEFQKNVPQNIKPEEKEEFENADVNEKKRTDEKRYFNKITSLFKDFDNQISFLINDLKENFTNIISNSSNFLNKEVIVQGINKVTENNNQIYTKLEEIEQLINLNSEILNLNYQEVAISHEKQQSEFVSLKQKFDTNREYYNRYNLLTSRLKEKQTLEQEIKEKENKKNRYFEERNFLIEKFNDVKNDIFLLRLNTIQKINSMLQGDIKITLKPSGIVDEFENRLKDALKGSGLKYNELVIRIVETFKPDEFAKIIQEKNIETLKAISGIDEYRSTAIINSLYDTESIYKIESIYCDDLPDFKLNIDVGDARENYKNSEELSMGQRCTTVLPIIFAVSDNPLIIDQPEDNLDNKYITDKIHDIIREQKDNRQLIFITHNPNIPVLSDSEYNLFLNYENKKSKILNEGDIDQVKDEILKILEGGEKAFNIRKNRYNLPE